jgi:hypothetical protein
VGITSHVGCLFRRKIFFTVVLKEMPRSWLVNDQATRGISLSKAVLFCDHFISVFLTT